MQTKSIFLVGDMHLRLDNLAVAKQFFGKLKQAIVAHRPSAVYFMGDLYDIKGIIRVEVQNFLAEWLLCFAHDLKTRCYILVGNHDMVGFSSHEHAFKFLDTLSPLLFKHGQIQIIGAPTHIINDDAGLNVVAMPYIKSGRQFLEQAKSICDKISGGATIMLTHQDYKGFFYRNGTPIDGDDIVEPDQLPNVNFVFNGHLHSNFVLKNIYNIGTPYTHNFGEVGNKTGVVVVEYTADGDIRHRLIPVNDIPKHINLYFDVTDAGLHMVGKSSDFSQHDFVRVQIVGLRDDCLRHGAKSKVVDYLVQHKMCVPDLLSLKYDFTDKQISNHAAFSEAAKIGDMLNKFIDINCKGVVAEKAKLIGADIMLSAGIQ